jgi:hypothetical protein
VARTQTALRKSPTASMRLLPSPLTGKRNGAHAPTGPAWLRGVPWPGLAVLVASGAYLALFYHGPMSSPDEGVIATAAERILRGQIPYRDFFSELGPGSFYLQAAVFKFGGINLASFRLTAWFLGVVLSGLTFCLSEQLMSGPAAYLPSLVFVAVCYPHNYQVSHHWWATLFFLLMVLCLHPHARRASGDRPAWSKVLLVVAGLLSAASGLCMQSAGAWAVLTGLIWLIVLEWHPGGQQWRDAVRRGAGNGLYFLMGAGVVAGLMASYLWAHGALREWIEDNLVFLFTNYWPYESAPSAYSWARLTRLISWLLREHSRQAFLYVVDHYFFCLVGPAIAFGGATWQVLRLKRVEPSRSRLLLLYLLGGLSSLFSELHAPDIYHFIFAAPLMLTLLFYSCLCAYRQWPWMRWPLRAVGGVTLVFVGLGVQRVVAHAATLTAAIPCRRGTLYRDPESALVVQQWIKTIQDAVPAGGETFIFPYDAHLYFLTGTGNPTRYDVLLAGFHSPKQIHEAIRMLQSRRPKYIFSLAQRERYTSRAHLPDDLPDIFEMHPLEKVLREPQGPYRLEKRVEGLEVWTLKK